MAALRKERGLTQVQLAELLGSSQQAVTAYENGTRRVPIATLPRLAQILGTPIEALIGTAPAHKASAKRGPAPKLQQQLEQIQALPKAEQRAITRVLDSVLAAHQ